jgi:hypothetical protein
MLAMPRRWYAPVVVALMLAGLPTGAAANPRPDAPAGCRATSPLWLGDRLDVRLTVEFAEAEQASQPRPKRPQLRYGDPIQMATRPRAGSHK